MNSLLADVALSMQSEFAPYVEAILQIAVVLFGAWALVRLSRRLIVASRGLAIKRTGHPEEVRRVETLSRVLRHLVTVLIVALTGMTVLSILGISIAPVLGAAGVVGVAIGFGAQSLVKDYFSGFFLLLEDQLRVGDVVRIAGKSGLVEEVTLRRVRLRGYEGDVHFVPTGLIDTVTNMTLEYSYALVDVGIAYRENLDDVFAAIRETGAVLRRDPIIGAKILENLELAGVEEWADSAVVVRCRIKVVPLEQWAVRREFLKRLKATFDERGIEIPFPHLTIYPGQAKDGTAPRLRLAVEAPPQQPLPR